MKSELDIIADISKRFDDLGIPYMLTGSIAMNYYADPRMTRDIDVVIMIRDKDIDALVNNFSPEYYIERDSVKESLVHESMFNLLHPESVIKVDCIVRKSSEYRHLEFERRQEVHIGHVSTWIVTKEDLIPSKLFWAKDSRSEMQLKDVANLMRTGYDETYVRRWAKTLNLLPLLREIPHE